MIKQKNKGITLIALVVTIVVLIILSGISISVLSGQNGILNRAQQAVEETSNSGLEEKINLILTENLIDEYTDESNTEIASEKLQNKLNEQGENVLVIQWDKYIIFDLNNNKEYRIMSDNSIEYWGESTMGTTLLNSTTPDEDQVESDSSTSNIIGIDNDGNTVNMLLWEYTLIEDSSLGKVGTYGLNDEAGLDGTGSAGRSAGYIGSYTEDGKIIGTVPSYISIDKGNTYVSVTSMVHTFYDCDNLVIGPEIPETIINMQVSFYQANNITSITGSIPNGVINLSYAFSNCESFNTIPALGNHVEDLTATFRYTAITECKEKLPDSITTMEYTFSNCTSLITFSSTIPNNVTNMGNSFLNCSSLQAFSSEIPDSVTSMQSTFYNCTSLQAFSSEIPDSVTSMQSTFFKCTSLVNGPSSIPNSVTNMFQTFSGCSNLEGTIEINANIDETIVYVWNGNQYTGYNQTFNGACSEGRGLTILKTGTTSIEMLNKLINGNSYISIEE